MPRSVAIIDVDDPRSARVSASRGLLARGRLARLYDAAKTPSRSENDGLADVLYTLETEDADRAIIDAVGAIAVARGVARGQIALALFRSKPIVTAPLVGASKTRQIDDAIRSLDIDLTSDEVISLESPYTPRWDFQGVSDDVEMQAIMARLPQFVPQA